MALGSCICTTRTYHADEMRNYPPFYALALSEVKNCDGTIHESWKHENFLTVCRSCPSATSTSSFLSNSGWRNLWRAACSSAHIPIQKYLHFRHGFLSRSQVQIATCTPRWTMSKTKSSWEPTYVKHPDKFNSYMWPKKAQPRVSCAESAFSGSYKIQRRLSFYLPPRSVQTPPCSSKSWFTDAMRGFFAFQNNNMYAYEHCFSDLSEHTQYPQENETNCRHVRQTLSRAVQNLVFGPFCLTNPFTIRTFRAFPKTQVEQPHAVRDCCASSKVTYTTTQEKRLSSSY